jgi:hypothetical protein
LKADGPRPYPTYRSRRSARWRTALVVTVDPRTSNARFVFR